MKLAMPHGKRSNAFLFPSVLVGVVLLGRARTARVNCDTRLASPKPRQNLSSTLEAFDNFKHHLATEQVGWIQECASKVEIESTISCGNTVKCLIGLMAKEGAEAVRGPPISDIEAALEKQADGLQSSLHAALISGGEDVLLPLMKLSSTSAEISNATEAIAEKMRRDMSAGGVPDFIIDGEVHSEMERIKKENTDGLRIEVINTLVNTEGATEFLRELNMQSLMRLTDELFKTDVDEELPRVFVPYIEWNRLDKAEDEGSGRSVFSVGQSYQNHIFVILKRSNDNFQFLNGYVHSSYERGYDLTDWLCSENILANPNGVGPTALAFEFLRWMEAWITDASNPTGKWNADNFARMFLVRERAFQNQPYFGYFGFSEIENDDLGSSQPLLVSMVKEVTPAEQTYHWRNGEGNHGDLHRETEAWQNRCQDGKKIHGGSYMYGERLGRRPGTMGAVGGDDNIVSPGVQTPQHDALCSYMPDHIKKILGGHYKDIQNSGSSASAAKTTVRLLDVVVGQTPDSTRAPTRPRAAPVPDVPGLVHHVDLGTDVPNLQSIETVQASGATVSWGDPPGISYGLEVVVMKGKQQKSRCIETGKQEPTLLPCYGLGPGRSKCVGSYDYANGAFQGKTRKELSVTINCRAQSVTVDERDLQ